MEFDPRDPVDIYNNYEFTTEDPRRQLPPTRFTSSKRRAWAPTSRPCPPGGDRHAPSTNPLTNIGLEKFLKDWEKVGRRVKA